MRKNFVPRKLQSRLEKIASPLGVDGHTSIGNFHRLSILYPYQLIVPGRSSFVPLSPAKSLGLPAAPALQFRGRHRVCSYSLSVPSATTSLACTSVRTPRVLRRGFARAYLRDASRVPPPLHAHRARRWWFTRSASVHSSPPAPSLARPLSLSLSRARCGASSSSSSSARRGIARAESRWSSRVGSSRAERNRAVPSTGVEPSRRPRGGRDARE